MARQIFTAQTSLLNYCYFVSENLIFAKKLNNCSESFKRFADANIGLISVKFDESLHMIS
jgi:hypothetical protein